MGIQKLLNKAVSLVLAVVMMAGIFSAVSPQQAEAKAKEKAFKSKGTSSVTINAYWFEPTEWIKFTAGATGYITVKATALFPPSYYDYVTYGDIVLCNSTKHAIGLNPENLSSWGKGGNINREITYGVRKGQTYYFKVNFGRPIKLTATVKSVKKSTANSRKEAKGITKNKSVKGVIIAGENKADWYKIKLTKRQILKLTYSAKTNGKRYTGVRGNGKNNCDNSGFRISFYKSNGQPYMISKKQAAVYRASTTRPKGQLSIFRSTTDGKKIGIEPGTYYVKVERYSKTTSGYYTLKWQ